MPNPMSDRAEGSPEDLVATASITSSRRSKLLSWRTFAVAAGLSLVAVACGDSDDTSAASETTAAEVADDDMADEDMADDEMAEDDMSDEDDMADDDMSEEDDMADDDMAEDDMSEEDDMMDEMSMEPVRFTVTVENISNEVGDVRRAVVFNTPDGADAPGPLLPGGSYSAVIAASPGERLSFATMFVQSNDWIIANGDEGIELYDADGNPFDGDITDQLLVLDAGTEIDQVPGEGVDQAPRQAGPDTGADDPDPTVRVLDRDAANYVQVSLTPAETAGYFDLVITNVSETAAVTTPLAPGVAVVHENANPLFTIGEADFGEGLEAVAEDGDPSELIASLEAVAAVPTPIAPVAAVIHHDPTNPIFESGGEFKADGLEELAEDGGPGGLVESVGAIAAAVPDGGSEAGPALPGQSYTFEFDAVEGDRLSLAFMLVQSNDWFFGIDSLDLYADGEALGGDISDVVSIYDAGTEVDQTPGVGADQAPRQAGPNTGDADEDTTVRIIDTNDGLVRVTIAADMG